MRNRFTRYFLGLTAALLLVPWGCGSGSDEETDSTTPADLASDVSLDVADSQTEDLVSEDINIGDLLDQTDFMDQFDVQEEDIQPDTQVAEVISGPSGCIQCHTNKDTLVAVAPEEPVEEESGGGG